MRPPERGQDAGGVRHPQNVGRRRFAPDQDRRIAGVFLGGAGIERDAPGGDADSRHGRMRQRCILRAGKTIENQSVEIDAHQPFQPLRRFDEVFRNEIDRDRERGPGRPLGVARLQQIEPPFLDGELEVLDVAEHRLQRPARLLEPVPDRG